MKKHDSAFGLFIDEMQDLDPDLLGALLAVQHRAAQRKWPFFINGAGLPDLPAVLADTRSYAERQFAYSTIGPLSATDAAEALTIPIERFGGSLTTDALDILVEASGGYPTSSRSSAKQYGTSPPPTPSTPTTLISPSKSVVRL